VDLKGLKPGAYSVSVYRTGFEANDAHTAYLKMGSPKTLTPKEIERLQALTMDRPQTSTVRVPASGAASVKVKMRVNDVVLVKINPQ
jgi:xylan 1,4-beta-xylosidase